MLLGGAFQPEFAAPIANLTVPLGRDAMLTCLVEYLGGYRVRKLLSISFGFILFIKLYFIFFLNYYFR